MLILLTQPQSVTIHWKAVDQYFTVVLFVNPLTPRVKPWVIQSFLSFDSMNRTLKCDHSLESCWAVLYCLFFQFYPVCNFEKIINFGLVGTVRSEWLVKHHGSVPDWDPCSSSDYGSLQLGTFRGKFPSQNKPLMLACVLYFPHVPTRLIYSLLKESIKTKSFTISNAVTVLL